MPRAQPGTGGPEGSVDFRILGPIEARRNGSAVELGAPKQRAILAILLLHAGEVVSSDRLIDLVWGDDPPRTAAHSVQTYVSELRQAFDGESGILVTRRPGYTLDVEPDRIDARRFERLVGEAGARLDGDPDEAARIVDEALAMWNGPPLGEFEYDDFARRDIERLEEVHRRALLILASAFIARNQPDVALPLLREAGAADPLAEDAQRLLMIALYHDGRQAEALRSYRTYRERLATETGLDPSSELARLEEQMLLRDPELGEAAEPRRAAVRNPYKGLHAFDESDAGDFFGRDGLIEELVEACTSPMTVVVGPSGSGKSSAVRAGLIPRLRDMVPDRSIVVIVPGRHPFLHLETELSRALQSDMAIDRNDAAGVLRAVLPELPPSGMLLVIDQFEEVFTLADEETRRSFLANVVSLTEEHVRPISVLLTIRADCYDRPLLYPDFAERFAANVVSVLPLAPAGIEAAAVEPARRVGVAVAADLVAQLVADVTDRPGALPLFQYALTELFAQRTEQTLTLEDYDRVGRLVAALSRRAEAVYGAMTREEQETARSVFLSLVKPDADRFIGRPVPVLDLEVDAPDAAAVSAVLTRFGQERLLSFGRDPTTGTATCEVAHEALLEGWDRLAGWLAEARDDLERIDTLLDGAAHWERAGRNPDYLLAGTRLGKYEIWAEETPRTLPSPAGEYLEASLARRAASEAQEARRVDRERRMAHRARVRLWGLFGAVAALVALATFAAFTILGDDGPDVVLAYEGPSTDWGAPIQAGVEQAVGEFDLDVGTETASPEGAVLLFSDIVAGSPDLILNGFGSASAVDEIMAMAEAHPDIEWVMPDLVVGPEDEAAYPNVSFPVFAAHEGSFLAGAAAAATTETGTVGFVGGVQSPIIWAYQAGFEAGVHAVDSDIEILVDYLSPPWDISGFLSPTLAFEHASELYARGADVVYAVVGHAGIGVADAAHEASEATGVHRWMIGVDIDLYNSVAAQEPIAELDYYPERRLPHILTSVLKRTDTAFYAALEDYAGGTFSAGIRWFDLANDGVGLATSGGHIDDIVPQLDRLKAAVVGGDIEVPVLPEGMEE